MPPLTLPLAVAVLWGVGGVLALVGRATVRLSDYAIEAIEAGLTGGQWAILVGWVAFMAYSEGYRGFQKRFSPRVAARALQLAAEPRPLRLLLAPAFCMGLFHATRRRLIASWVLLISIVLLVLLIRGLEQPWRGVIDAGVVVGLAWGWVATLVSAIRALASGEGAVPHEVA